MHRLIYTLTLATSILSVLYAFNATAVSHTFLGRPLLDNEATSCFDNYKWEVANEVFTNLVEAKGVKNMPVPKFKMVTSQRNVAWFNPNTIEVGLEEKAYDICTSFGKDSLNVLAAIIGHELIHYYEKHGWTELFAADFANMEMSAEIGRLDQHLPQETQADFLGGFLSYSAGYRNLEVMPAFLDKVYQAYGLPEVMSGYPSLAERKEMARASLQRCQDLIHAFEMANYLIAVEDYDYAKEYYAYILKEFQSREMYNNIGVANVLAAMNLFPKQALPFVYPIELDAESRLKNNKKSASHGFGGDEKGRVERLKNAVDYFKTAIILDESYAVGYLNLACAYALLEQPIDARYNAQKALQIARTNKRSKTVADAQIILGIIASQEADMAGANQFFDKAIATGSTLALLNKSILNEEPHSLNKANDRSIQMLDNIGDLSLDRLITNLERGNLSPDKMLEINSQVIFGLIDYPHSQLLIHLLPQDEHYFILQISAPTYEKETNKAIKNGASKSSIIAAYGPADNNVQLAQGEYLVYYKQRLLFIIDEGGTLKTWATFRVSR